MVALRGLKHNSGLNEAEFECVAQLLSWNGKNVIMFFPITS